MAEIEDTQTGASADSINNGVKPVVQVNSKIQGMSSNEIILKGREDGRQVLTEAQKTNIDIWKNLSDNKENK